MTCLQILFLFSMTVFVGTIVYALIVTADRQEPDAAFPPLVDPWAMTGRRITDPNQVEAIYRGATGHEKTAITACDAHTKK